MPCRVFSPAATPVDAAARAESRAHYAIDATSTQVYKQTIEDAICELHDKVRANQIQIIDGTYSTRALRLLLSK